MTKKATEAQEAQQQVAVKTETAIVVVDDTALYDLAGDGNQLVRPEDVSSPFLRVLQSGSPECKRNEPEYIPGAAEGLLLHTVTRKLYTPPVEIIDCFFEPLLMEWVPRAKGGGLVRIYNGSDPIMQSTKRNDKGKDVLPNENELSAVAQHYVLLIDPEAGLLPVVIGLASTQLKKSRRLNALLNNQRLQKPDGSWLTAPRYASVLTLTTVGESNDQGSWSGVEFALSRRVTAEELAAARALKDAVQSGAVRNRPSEELAREASTGDDRDIPF